MYNLSHYIFKMLQMMPDLYILKLKPVHSPKQYYNGNKYPQIGLIASDRPLNCNDARDCSHGSK